MTHFIQRAGVATTSISLIREHSEAIGPTRALWVPFPLGRPLGVPEDPAFQRAVVVAALDLLESPSQPLLEDYPVEAPDSTISEVWACPISLPKPDGSDLARALRAEIDELMPWYAEAKRARGRSPLANSGATDEQLDQIVDFVLAMAEGHDPLTIPDSVAAVAWRHKMPILIRHVCQDLRAFYEAAALARPGESLPHHAALNNWIYHETALGRAVLAIGQRITDHPDPRFKLLRSFLIPEGYWPEESSAKVTPSLEARIEFAIAANAFLSGESD